MRIRFFSEYALFELCMQQWIYVFVVDKLMLAMSILGKVSRLSFIPPFKALFNILIYLR